LTCCRAANPCRRLRWPLNGVLMCSSTQTGGTQQSHDTVCQLFCNRGYVPARSLGDHPQTAGSFHCDRTGTWQPTDHVPSCVGKSTSKQSINLSVDRSIDRSVPYQRHLSIVNIGTRLLPHLSCLPFPIRFFHLPPSCAFQMYIIKGDMFICLPVCLSVADGRPNGWADQDQTWHRDSC